MIDCDFIPSDYHQARSMHRAVKLRGGLVSAMIVIMVLWVVANQHQVSKAGAMLTEVVAQHEQIGVHLAKKEAMEAEQKRLQDHQRLVNHFRRPASLVVVFSDISSRLPETVVLTQVSFQMPSLQRFAVAAVPEKAAAPAKPAGAPDAKAEPPTPTSTEIRMTAFASEVSEAIASAAALERSPLMARVQMELKGDAVWAGRQGQQFELTCELNRQTGVDE